MEGGEVQKASGVVMGVAWRNMVFVKRGKAVLMWGGCGGKAMVAVRRGKNKLIFKGKNKYLRLKNSLQWESNGTMCQS